MRRRVAIGWIGSVAPFEVGSPSLLERAARALAGA